MTNHYDGEYRDSVSDKVEVKHNNYAVMYSKALEEIKRLKLRVQEEKLRADLLQKDLDNYDDFLAMCETETARALTRKVS